MQPDYFAELPKPKGKVWVPLLINATLLLLLLSSVLSGNGIVYNAGPLLATLLGLWLLNAVAMVIAGVMGKSKTALGFVFSLLLIPLVGLGTCASVIVPGL